MSISKEAVLNLLGDRPIAYHPILAKKLGGVEAAVFVSQLLYWTGRSKLPNGWIFKSQAEFEEETGLTRRNQETARKKLKELGVLEEELKGIPAVLHFRLNLEKIAGLLDTPQTSMAEPALPVYTYRTNLYGGIRQTPENTTETTSEKTIVVSQQKTPAKKPKKPISPAVLIHQQVTEYYQITSHWREQITLAVGDTPDSLEKWKETLIAWTGRSFFGGNVQGQLAWFKEGVPKRTNKEDTLNYTIRNGRNTLVIS